MRAQADEPLDEVTAAQLEGQALIDVKPGDGQPAPVMDLQADRYFLSPEGSFFEFALADEVLGRLAGPDEADDVNAQE